jgi:hypothetical protein
MQAPVAVTYGKRTTAAREGWAILRARRVMVDCAGCGRPLRLGDGVTLSTGVYHGPACVGWWD